MVVSILHGETSMSRELTVAEVEDWQDRFLSGAGNSARSMPKDHEALREEKVRRLKQMVGELVVDNEILREAVKRTGGPFVATDV